MKHTIDTPAVGSTVLICHDTMYFQCTVKETRTAEGGFFFLLVTPVVGSGEQWVELSRVLPDLEAK